ncbi:YhgE/Pip domain-containing protein [Paenibacillus sp. CGMCC 1.16610]|uniref:ABC transporter permease n=1 Tax=Paenibacillus anseongense TaxID=2682845 RepID=A0ABW9UEP5_9BACL|nr:MULTISPECIES: YhgE/Pip domain-containing protein [Paenibacillus]MBA2940168.1 YhgE/Pip domain-containing protein [Paenibacillus sp. CGMCC 1.16610]MVQ38622.1 ABC transporter permease [Paenibacillus anseongense]
MKKIFSIYRTDLINLWRVPTGLLLMVALAILPSVYAWINLEAMWDPYSNTSGIKIAVTSNDKGAKIEDKSINIGNEVVDNLKENHTLGWTFVDEATALNGVERGDYYASLIIPEDFSRKITSIVDGEMEKPEIVYTVNEKINAVAPKITSKGASSVSQQISENFIKTVSNSILTRMKEIGIDFEKELPTIRNMESKILELENRLPEIETMGGKALELEQKLPELKEKGQKIVQLEEKIPDINRAADTVLKIEERWPKIQAVAQEVLLIQQKLPEIQKAASRVAELDQNFGKVEEVLNTAIDKSRKADEIVSAALDTLPKIDAIATQGAAFADALTNFLQKNEAAFQTLIPVVKQNLTLLQQTADAVTQLTGVLQDVNIDPQKSLAAIGFLSERLTSGAAVLDNTIDVFTRLNTNLPNSPFADTISRLTALRTNMANQIQALNKLQTAIGRGEKPAKDIVNNLNTLSKEASSALGGILSRYDSEIVPNMTKAFGQILTVAQNAGSALQTLKTQLPNIKGILTDAQNGIHFAQTQLDTLQKELPDIRAKVHEASSTLQSKLDAFTTGINEAAPFIRNDLPRVEQKLHTAADFIRNDLPAAEEEIRKVADLYQTKLPEVEDAVHLAANLVRSDLPAFEEAVHKAADQIRKVQGSGSVDEVLRLLQNDIQKQSDFLSNPVLIKEDKRFPIPNYGSAMSPFYTTLSLWVGAMLLVSLMRVDVDNLDGVYKTHHIYFGRMMIFLTIGLFQALIVTLGDIFILGTYVVDKIWFVIFALLISIVFITITYTLVSVFGNIGKGIAIIFLVLQFSSSGGTFPVSTASPFFQKLNPFVPFTYAVGVMREAVGGMLLWVVLKDVLCLCVFIVVCYIVALALKKPLSGYTKRVAEKAKMTKLIS